MQNGTAYELGVFLVTQTDMSPAEARAALDQSLAGDPEKVHHAGGSYEAGRASAEALLHPSEIRRRELQAINDAGFEAELAKRGGRVKDNRSDRQKQMDEDFARIAQRAGRRDQEDDDDSSDLKAMGFGSSSLDTGAYNAGREAASRILGRPSASAPSRGADGGYGVVRHPAATPTAPAGDAYSAGAESAKRLLFGNAAVKAELDAELRSKFADQQARRAQQE
jgi:hypothetical protein